MTDLESISIAQLDRVTGGADHAFNDGPFLTEVLRQGMSHRATSSHAAPRPHLTRSKAAPGWCEDGFGIVPCR